MQFCAAAVDLDLGEIHHSSSAINTTLTGAQSRIGFSRRQVAVLLHKILLHTLTALIAA